MLRRDDISTRERRGSRIRRRVRLIMGFPHGVVRALDRNTRVPKKRGEREGPCQRQSSLRERSECGHGVTLDVVEDRVSQLPHPAHIGNRKKGTKMGRTALPIRVRPALRARHTKQGRVGEQLL